MPSASVSFSKFFLNNKSRSLIAEMASRRDSTFIETFGFINYDPEGVARNALCGKLPLSFERNLK
jgi:hypothetical protein